MNFILNPSYSQKESPGHVGRFNSAIFESQSYAPIFPVFLICPISLVLRDSSHSIIRHRKWEICRVS